MHIIKYECFHKIPFGRSNNECMLGMSGRPSRNTHGFWPPAWRAARWLVDLRDAHPLEEAEARWRPSLQGEGCDFPIPRPAATACSLVRDTRFPLAGLVSSFPRNVGGGDLPDSVGLIPDFPSPRHTVSLLSSYSSIITTFLSYKFYWSRIHSSIWLLTQRMGIVMLATSHQTWHLSSPAFRK